MVVKKSIRDYCDTAVIKLPATAVLKKEGQSETISVDTAKQFVRGDKVAIQCGYSGKMVNEFEGFVSRINKTTPCEIECEGYAFQLRGKQISHVWQNASLKSILSDIIAGTDIVLAKDIDEILVDKMVFIKVSGFQALGELSKQFKGAVAFWFDKNVLYAGLALTKLSARNKSLKPDAYLKIGYNVARDGQMKERIAGDNKYDVEFVFKEKTGKRQIARAGIPNSNSIRKNIQAVKDMEWRQKMAQEQETSKNYTGYEGKITAFLQPYCKPSQKLHIEDPRYPERSGNYLIESTELKYGVAGARRTITISIKI